jgi:hypothetical protein
MLNRLLMQNLFVFRTSLKKTCGCVGQLSKLKKHHVELKASSVHGPMFMTQTWRYHEKLVFRLSPRSAVTNIWCTYKDRVTSHQMCMFNKRRVQLPYDLGNVLVSCVKFMLS